MDPTNTFDPAAARHAFSHHPAGVSAAYGPTQTEPAAARTFLGEYERRPDGAAAPLPGGELRGFFPPPPPFACRPPGLFSSLPPPTLVNTHRDLYSYPPYSPQQYGCGPPPSPFPGPARPWGEDRGQGGPDRGQGAGARAESDAAAQRRRDAQWVRDFTRDKAEASTAPKKKRPKALNLGPVLYGAAQLVTQLDALCSTLRDSVRDSDAWTDPYTQAVNLRKELEDKFAVIDCADIDAWKTKLRRKAEKRTRKHQQDAEKRRQERISEKEAAIDAWRLRHIRGVEEKKKERELKLAADAVLCEVRKKQADVKRMQDILRSLQKLHRLRKEAAIRKGIVIEKKCEEAFSHRLDQLSSMLKVRTSVYATEEKALKVMIEGEHEEEKRRDQEKQMKKEKEKFLLRKRMMDAVLFGEFPIDAAPQPFMDFYNQAECSVHALLQIRSEWDMFVVAADHPDGSSIPQNWVVPDQPSDEVWASALQPMSSG